MSQLVTSSTASTSQTPRRGRAPWTVWTLSTVVLLLALVTSYGAVYFTFVFDDPEPGLGSWLFVLTFFTINLTAAWAALGLLRGRRAAWQLLVAYGIIGILWCIAKLVFWQEAESLVFGTANVLALALLAAPRTRRHVD